MKRFKCFSSLIILSFVLLFPVAIRDNCSPGLLSYLEHNARSGDVIFREGKGFFSQWFSKAGGTSTRYSHVGIVVMEPGRVHVIHSEASEVTGIGTVRKDSVADFLSTERAGSFAVYRPHNLPPRSIANAVGNAERLEREKIPFDTSFDVSDQKRLYCTEFVYFAYLQAGIRLVDRMDTFDVRGKKHPIISIANLLDSKKLKAAYFYPGGTL